VRRKQKFEKETDVTEREREREKIDGQLIPHVLHKIFINTSI
jgi:hypothetical protein